MMATVGKPLLEPQVGWKRFSAITSAISYTGSWEKFETNITSYQFNNNVGMYSTTPNDTMKFNFTGKRLLLKAYGNNDTSGFILTIDGTVQGSFKTAYNTTSTVVVYEKTDFEDREHSVEIKVLPYTSVSGATRTRVLFDSVDVDQDKSIGIVKPTVGQQLTAPESGWKRYDDTTSEIKYEGAGWVSATGDSNTYAGTGHYLILNGVTSNNITFNFYGTKIRIIDLYWTNRVNNVTIDIDGVVSTWNPNNSSNKYQVLVFEKSELSKTIHKVKIFTDSLSGTFSIDALDIDSEGRLFHPEEVTNVAELEIGKRIRCHYQSSTANTVGVFSGLGEQTSELIPPTSSATPNGDFYFIMVEDRNGRKQLVADRNIQSGISWDTMNSSGIVGGVLVSLFVLEEVSTSIRLLTGGITAIDKDDEWDKYIVNSTMNGQIKPGDNNVWNWSGVYSWTSTTNTYASNNRTVRGNSNVGSLSYTISNNVAHGFRPMLEAVILPMNRSLIKHDGSYKKWNTDWNAVSTTIPPENAFISEGMGDLSVLDRKPAGFNQTMTLNGNLGSGKVFKTTINLEKYLEITNLSVK
nr:hypothetical protein [Paenibacillus xylanexedens]